MTVSSPALSDESRLVEQTIALDQARPCGNEAEVDSVVERDRSDVLDGTAPPEQQATSHGVAALTSSTPTGRLESSSSTTPGLRDGERTPASGTSRPARSGMLHERLDRDAQRSTAGAGVSVDLDGAVAAATSQEISNVWRRYKSRPDAQLRERLILCYAPLVTSVASRVGMKLPSTVEHADLVSYGMFGLIDAIEKFEIDREIKFETYATSRIRGAILDELRATDWVPRSVRSKARAVDRAHAALEAVLHRAPTDLEIADHMEIALSDLRSIRHLVSTVNLVALDEVFGTSEQLEPAGHLDTGHGSRSTDPARTFESKETKFLLSQAMDQLGEREKIMLVLYYYEGKTLAEIGHVLGVTESRVSQMHTAAMGRLREKLSRSDGA